MQVVRSSEVLFIMQGRYMVLTLSKLPVVSARISDVFPLPSICNNIVELSERSIQQRVHLLMSHQPRPFYVGCYSLRRAIWLEANCIQWTALRPYGAANKANCNALQSSASHGDEEWHSFHRNIGPRTFTSSCISSTNNVCTS